MTEEWRDVVGFPGYMISSLGRVKSFQGKTPKILAESKTTNGYRKVTMKSPDGLRTRLIHKLVAEAFIGPRPANKPCIRHLDGNKLNNHPSNLEYGTYSDNSIDVVVHGNHKLAKLTYDDTAEIKKLYATGEYTYRSLGRLFDVDSSQISRVINGQTWRREGVSQG